MAERAAAFTAPSVKLPSEWLWRRARGPRFMDLAGGDALREVVAKKNLIGCKKRLVDEKR
jgi:hypothetical protein